MLNPPPLWGRLVGGRPRPRPKTPLLAEQTADAGSSAPPPNPPHKGEGLRLQPGLRARFILHVSDFTTDGSPEPDQLDQALLEHCVERPEDVSHFLVEGRHVRGEGSRRGFDPQVPCQPARAPRHPQVQPHPHEPRPQRLSGEPLPQRRRRHAGGLSGLDFSTTMQPIGRESIVAALAALFAAFKTGART